MKFLIRQRVRADKNSEQNQYFELQIQTQRLTIGRAPDQNLQIAESSVELQHAFISLNRDGQIHIKALTANGFKINGEPQLTANLSVGDSVQIGSTTITVEESQIDHPVVLSIDYHAGSEKDTLKSLHHTELSQLQISKHSLSWVLVISVVTLFFLIPVAGVIYPPLQQLLRDNDSIPDDSLWLTGPLHSSHQAIGKDCNACHIAPFKMVKNQQCLECHTDVQHHVDISSDSVDNFEQYRCAHCHREHNEPDILVQHDQRLCTDCHGSLDKLKPDTKLANITDFGDDHPDFRLTLLQPHHDKDKIRWEPVRSQRDPLTPIAEQSFLQFSHKQHLNPKGIRSPDGDQVLECQNCHQPDVSGQQMQPITMEQHCSECHSLKFDENNQDKEVPHGDFNALYETLKEHFSHQFLDPDAPVSTQDASDQPRIPGEESRILSLEERQRALDWAEKQSLSIAEDLIEDQMCIECHKISKNPAKTGFEQWHVEPVVLNNKWMPLARFDHASHDVEKCTHCHEKAEKSEKSSDILIPKIKICRECHVGVKDDVKLKSDCLMCHQFHLPEKGLFDPEQRKAAEKKSLLEVDSSTRLKTDKVRN